MSRCAYCGGDGARCWQCGEREAECECGAPNIGTCDRCEGTGDEPKDTKP